jgi:uncharacterized protein (TIGR00255 family)
MIHSMTAFAREQEESPLGTVVVEIRSVNHRYLDSTFKLPEPLRGLEPAWREQLQKAVARGKLECQARWLPACSGPLSLDLDEDRLQQLIAAARRAAELAGDSQALNPLDLLQWPGVLLTDRVDEKALLELASGAFSSALAALVEGRSREGSRLAGFIAERLDQVQAHVADTRSRMPELLAAQRQRIEQKLAQLEVEAEPGRLEQELVFLAQKADVDEELDRLAAHVDEVRRALDKGGPCGRRLDFLMQELNREANTLSSKSISSGNSSNAVELKVLIEQMREQVQNLE